MSRKVLAEFQARLASVESTRAKMETLFVANAIDIRDIETVYDAMFLRVVTGFEQFCDDLFFSIIHRQIRYPKPRQVITRIKADQDTIQAILFSRGDKKYLDWMPYKNTIARSELFWSAENRLRI